MHSTCHTHITFPIVAAVAAVTPGADAALAFLRRELRAYAGDQPAAPDDAFDNGYRAALEDMLAVMAGADLAPHSCLIAG